MASFKLENVAVAPVTVALDCARPAKRSRPDEGLTPIPTPTILEVPGDIVACRQ